MGGYCMRVNRRGRIIMNAHQNRINRKKFLKKSKITSNALLKHQKVCYCISAKRLFNDKKREVKTMYSVFDIANWFLSQKTMTHKKLQKMCYYAQAWSYALYNRPLMDTEFQAWVHGPVSPQLYQKYKGHGFQELYCDEELHISFSEEDSELLEWVCPKICVNTIIGANRAILIQGGSRGIRLPSCLQHNAGGDGCQGRRSRLITLDIRAQRCYSGMRSAK